MLNFFLKREKQYIRIHPQIILDFFIIGFSILFLFFIRKVLLLFYLSFIIMVALTPMVKKFKKLKLPNTLAVSLSYIVSIFLVVLTFYIIVPPLIVELSNLLTQENLKWINNIVSIEKIKLMPINEFAGTVSNSLKTLSNIISSTFNGALTFITIFILSFYLSLERETLENIGFSLTNNKQEALKIKIFIKKIQEDLGGWVRGQLILMTIIGLITYIGLTIIGIEYALPLGILAFFMEILPNLGPTIAATPAIAIPLIDKNYILSITILLFYIFVQQIENNLIVPKVMEKSANVNPLIAILSIMIGIKVDQFMGAFLAIPTFIIIRAFFEIFIKKYNEDEI